MLRLQEQSKRTKVSARKLSLPVPPAATVDQLNLYMQNEDLYPE